jgi:hypothetical protein
MINIEPWSLGNCAETDNTSEDRSKTGLYPRSKDPLQMLDTLGLTSSQGNETHKIEHILELIRQKD